MKREKSIESADWLWKRGEEKERGERKMSQVPGLDERVDGEMAVGSKVSGDSVSGLSKKVMLEPFE